MIVEENIKIVVRQGNWAITQLMAQLPCVPVLLFAAELLYSIFRQQVHADFVKLPGVDVV